MTKTKRQLRAEAVERLKNWPADEKAGPLLDTVLGKSYDPYDYEKDLAALIDLLTDDEPPEGDAVDKLREWLVDEANINEWKNTWFTVTEQICELDVMLEEIKREIERDYVLRDLYDEATEAIEQIVDEREDVKYENQRQARKIRKVCELNEKLTAERDYWKQQVQACMDAAYPPSHSPEPSYAPEVMAYPARDGYTTPATMVSAVIDGLRDERSEQYMGIMAEVSQLTAERDEWKAKAEHDGARRGMANLEWMCGEDPFFRDFCEWYAVYKSHADDDMEVCEWLLSEHGREMREHTLEPESGQSKDVKLSDLFGILGDDCGQNADMSGNASDCVREEPETSVVREHSLKSESHTLKSESDQREAGGDEVIRNAGKYEFAGEPGGVNYTDGENASQAEARSPGRLTNGDDMLHDDREKLEADLNAWCIELWDSDAVSGFQTANLVKRKVWEFLYRQAAITERECSDAFRDYRVRKLGITGLADLQSELKRERAQREHWRRVAGKHAAEVQRLKAEVIRYAQDCGECATAMPRGVEWPRFEDGELVKPGDVVWEDNYGNVCAGREREVYEIDFAYLLGPRCWLRDRNGGTIYAENMYEHGPAKRPPLMAADGKPIEVGQVLYGEDGQAWTVDRIDYGQPHSVIAHCGDSERGLKPGWLTHEPPVLASDGVPIKLEDTVYFKGDPMPYTVVDLDAGSIEYNVSYDAGGYNEWTNSGKLTHEPPDSARVIAKELREFVSTHLIAMGNGQYEEHGELNDLADRIEKLAKEGA